MLKEGERVGVVHKKSAVIYTVTLALSGHTLTLALGITLVLGVRILATTSPVLGARTLATMFPILGDRIIRVLMVGVSRYNVA